ncbi:unnamed protein product [Schistosoma curassoni]|uniref:Secreted protein n=1 Tax=Schistosoma curassoni TaxID=6186 RepID=A0A183KYK9_9TREM|nr:unnamed protein product [Schistosoma curassoni]
MSFNCRYAALALLIRAFTSSSDPPCSSVMLPTYLFVGTVNSIALLFFWDQLFLNSFNCDVIIEFAETILVLLGSDILQVNNFTDMEQLLNHGPNKLLTKDIIQTWNMIHLHKVLDDDYYKLNRLSGKLV